MGGEARLSNQKRAYQCLFEVSEHCPLKHNRISPLPAAYSRRPRQC